MKSDELLGAVDFTCWYGQYYYIDVGAVFFTTILIGTREDTCSLQLFKILSNNLEMVLNLGCQNNNTYSVEVVYLDRSLGKSTNVRINVCFVFIMNLLFKMKNLLLDMFIWFWTVYNVFNVLFDA